MKITVETDNGKIHAYDGAIAAFLTVDMGDSYENLVDGAVSPGFAEAVSRTVAEFTHDFLCRLMKELPETKKLMDMIADVVGADDEDEDAEEDTECDG